MFITLLLIIKSMKNHKRQQCNSSIFDSSTSIVDLPNNLCVENEPKKVD